jgi:ADP-heptose:LPS heptosyltransferase
VKKILIIRFSSIGDIVLTTPVIRCIKQQLKKAELHYVTKEIFAPVLKYNPNIDRLFTFKKDISELYDLLQSQNYDLVVDLHKNLRSLRLKQKLKAKSYSFNKINIPKFLAVNFKMRSVLPQEHIVERYLAAVKEMGVTNDRKGLDYFLDAADQVDTSSLFFGGQKTKFIALVAGGSYYTKKIPVNKLKEICSLAKLPVLILGGKEDTLVANELLQHFTGLIDTCGKFSINQSASIIQQAEWVITSDTGLMHIASAFHKKIISVWGNTIPQFGMEPYLPNPENKILEIKNLSCRPCSKLGYKKCPKGHFKCMNEIDYSFVSELK